MGLARRISPGRGPGATGSCRLRPARRASQPRARPRLRRPQHRRRAPRPSSPRGTARARCGSASGFRYDTRDSQHQPYSGWRVGVLVDAAPWQSDGSMGAIFTGYGNFVFPVPPLFHSRRRSPARRTRPPTRSRSGSRSTRPSAISPSTPCRASAGPTTLRGYIANRFTDNSAWHAVAEYRFWVIPRGFRHDPHDPGRARRSGPVRRARHGGAEPRAICRTAKVHASYGVGLRISLERLAVFRTDIGFSDEGTNLTIAFGLSF